VKLTRRQGLQATAALPAAAWAGVAATAGAQEAPSPLVPQARNFGESIGLQVKFYQGEPVEGLFALRDLKVRWVREEHHWHDYEPAAGYYRGFTGGLINRLRFYRQQDIGVVFILAYSNGVAYPATREKPLAPIDPEAFGRYAADVAKRLQRAGVRFVLEVWNEPHNGEIQKMVGGSWQGAGPAPWVHHYVKLVQAARDQARAIDPAIRVLSQDDMWICHYWFLEAGLPPDLDGFSVHPYQPTPERAAVAHDTDWCRPFQVVDRDASFRSGVRRLKEQGARKLGREPAIWITEMGWPVKGPEPKPNDKPERSVAAYVPRSYIAAFAAGVEVTCWFSSFDGPDGPMGLRDNRGDPREAYRAFRTMAAQLSPMKLTAQLAGQQNLANGLHAYHFRSERGEQCVVAWSADDRKRNVELPCESALDLFGKSATLEPGKAANLKRVTIGAEPVYLLGDWAVADLNPTLWQGLAA
jgi:hypothetical protein